MKVVDDILKSNILKFEKKRTSIGWWSDFSLEVLNLETVPRVRVSYGDYSFWSIMNPTSSSAWKFYL